MVKVKLFGLLRLDTGLKELELEANSVKELYPLILEAAHSARPGTAVTLKDMDGCIVIINGLPTGISSGLKLKCTFSLTSSPLTASNTSFTSSGVSI